MIATRFLKLASLFMMVSVVACAQPDPPAPEKTAGGMELGDELRWTPVDGAVEYRVQLWDGQRLLFEEVREQPVMPVTPVMRRTMVDVEATELQVRAFGPDGRQIGEIERRSYPAGAG